MNTAPEIRCLAVKEVVTRLEQQPAHLRDAVFSRAPRAREYAAKGRLEWAPVSEYGALLDGGQLVLGAERWGALVASAARGVLDDPWLGGASRMAVQLGGATPDSVFRVAVVVLGMAFSAAGHFSNVPSHGTKVATFTWHSVPIGAAPLVSTFALVLRAWFECLNAPARLELARTHDTATFTARWS